MSVQVIDDATEQPIPAGTRYWHLEIRPGEIQSGNSLDADYDFSNIADATKAMNDWPDQYAEMTVTVKVAG